MDFPTRCKFRLLLPFLLLQSVSELVEKLSASLLLFDNDINVFIYLAEALHLSRQLLGSRVWTVFQD